MMRNGGIGLIIGVVLGIVIGATVIAPRLNPQQRGSAPPVPPPEEIAKDLPKLLLPRPAVEMRMASAFASTMPIAGPLARRFDRQISEVSRGEMEIRFHEPGVLVPVTDLLDAVASGAVDAAFVAPGLLNETTPAFGLYGGFPFGPGIDGFLAWLFADEGISLLDELTHARGIHAVVCGVLPAAAAGWFRQPLELVADLRGLKISINGLGAKVLARLGAQPQPLDLATIKDTITAGKVDAVAFASPALDRYVGFQTVLANYYLPGWERSPGAIALIMNLKKWKELRSTQRLQIETVCGDNLRSAIADGESAQYEALKDLKAGGTQLQRLPTPIRDELRRVWSQIAEEEGNTNADFRRVWTSLSRFREEYEVWSGVNHP